MNDKEASGDNECVKTYPPYTDGEGVEWDSYEDYQIAKSQAEYVASRKRRSVFSGDAVPRAVN